MQAFVLVHSCRRREGGEGVGDIDRRVKNTSERQTGVGVIANDNVIMDPQIS